MIPAINLHCRRLSIAKFDYQMVPHGPRNYLDRPNTKPDLCIFVRGAGKLNYSCIDWDCAVSP